MQIIKKAFLGQLLLASCCGITAYAGDSTASLTNPAVSLSTVTDGVACSNPGRIAQTSSGNVAYCEGGVWQSQDLSNPEIAYSSSAQVTGFGGIGHFAACPAGKKAVSGGCIIWPGTASTADSNFGFVHDETTIAGGMYLGYPIAGDTGVYCLAVMEAGNSANVSPVAICVDR